MLKIRYDYRLFSLLSFLGDAILNFTTVATVIIQQTFICVRQLSNRITSWNPRWLRPGNLKAKIGKNQILFCPILKYYFHVFQRNFKVDCIFNYLTLICFNLLTLSTGKCCCPYLSHLVSRTLWKLSVTHPHYICIKVMLSSFPLTLFNSVSSAEQFRETDQECLYTLDELGVL